MNKKAATQLRGIKFLFAGFGITFMLIIFYVWVAQSVSGQSTRQAEIITAQTEYRIMFSDLIRTYGIELADKDAKTASQIIKQYADNYATIDQGETSVNCETKGIDKECTLTISLHPVESEIWTASLLLAAPAPYLMIKALGLDEIRDVRQQTYLPTKNKQAMKFSLDIKVNLL